MTWSKLWMDLFGSTSFCGIDMGFWVALSAVLGDEAQKETRRSRKVKGLLLSQPVSDWFSQHTSHK